VTAEPRRDGTHPRWRPEHSRQKKVPYVTDAHCGLPAPQSTQFKLPGIRRSSISTSFGIV